MVPPESQFECKGSYFFVPDDPTSSIVLPEKALHLLNEALPGRDTFIKFRDPELAFELYTDVRHYEDRVEEQLHAAELIPVFMDVLCLAGVAYVLEHRTACVRFYRDGFPESSILPDQDARIIRFPARNNTTD